MIHPDQVLLVPRAVEWSRESAFRDADAPVAARVEPGGEAKSGASSWSSSSSLMSACSASPTPQEHVLSVISAARPKIADYPFTTLEPHLGVVGLSTTDRSLSRTSRHHRGAHAGRGSGCASAHVERTRAVAVLVPVDSPDRRRRMIYCARNGVYSKELASKPHVVVLTKAI